MGSVTNLLAVESAGRAFQNQFEIQLSDLSENDPFSLATIFSISIESFSFNESPLALEGSYIGNFPLLKLSSAKYPSGCSCVIREFADFRVLRYFNNWVNLIFDREKNCFKKNIKNQIKTLIIKYTPTLAGENKPSLPLYSMSVLPKEIPSIQSLSHTSANIIKYNVSFFITGEFQELSPQGLQRKWI